MKNTKSHINTLTDLVNILNQVVDSTHPTFIEKKPITVSQLNYFSNHKLLSKRYTSFEIPKKNGSKRLIHAPVKALKFQLKCINSFLQGVCETHSAANGFVKNKSITDNAKVHVGKNYVYNIDLRDFFHCFNRIDIELMFQKKPFYFNNSKNLHLSRKLSFLCTHPLKVKNEIKVVLPQGSPASPTITNILCYDFDAKLTSLAKRFEADYSRYADDITFSCNKNIFILEKFLNPLKKIVTQRGFEINDQKTRLQNTYFKQEVTGLVVNEKINVNKRYIKSLRMWLYYLESYDITKTLSIFIKEYNLDKGHINKQVPSLFLVLDGKLNFLKMVRGEDDPLYLKLRKRFDKVRSKKINLTDSITIWAKHGIDHSINITKKQ